MPEVSEAYGYNSDGAILIVDWSVSGDHTERSVFTFGDHGYPAEETVVDVASKLISVKKSYTYDDSNRIVAVDVDSHLGMPDGIVDSTTAYTYDESGNGWTRETDKDGDGVMDITTTFAYDPDEKTVTFVKDSRSGSLPEAVVTLGIELENPSDFLLPTVHPAALSPESITMDDNGDGDIDLTATFVYEDDHLVKSETKTADGSVVEWSEFSYECE